MPKEDPAAFAAYVDMTVDELRSFCCADCFEYRLMVSEADYKECWKIIQEVLKDGKKSGNALAKMAAGKAYEFMCEAGYDAYIVHRYSNTDPHPLPLGIQLAINQSTNTDTSDFLKLYYRRVYA